jgi:hypothetical protein
MQNFDGLVQVKGIPSIDFRITISSLGYTDTTLAVKIQPNLSDYTLGPV